MDSVDECLDYVVEKHDVMETTYENLDSLLQECLKIQESLESHGDIETVPKDVSNEIECLIQMTDDMKMESTFSQGQRSLHAALNSLGRSIQDALYINLDGVTKDIQIPPPILYKWVVEHLLFHGNIDIAHRIIKEIGVDISEELILKYTTLSSLMTSLRNSQLDTLLNWIHEHEKHLTQSNLEYNVYKYQFLTLVKANKIEEAFNYAKEHFQGYRSKEMNDIYELMGMLVFSGSFNEVPFYKHLKLESFRVQVELLLCRDYCRIHNLPSQSHLFSSVQAGISAVPYIAKAKSIMPKDQWEALETLDVEVPLSDDLIFHSIFYCPVSKEVATISNLPQLLPCGHVLSKQSVQTLQTSRNRFSEVPGRFKCPYCPQRVRPADIVQIHFET